MRILALDWGTVRVGAAISDPGGTIAFALDTIIDSKTAISEIKILCSEQEVEKIILGQPKTLSSQNGESASKVDKFKTAIESETGLSVELIDERFSSVAAGKSLSSQGMSEKKQREIKDNIAAQLMLQQYLDNLNKR